MTSPNEQLATMLANLPEKTGRTLNAWLALIKQQQFERHGEIVKFLKSEHGVTHGYANLIATRAREAIEGGAPAPADLVAAQYAGKKAALRPIHDAVVEYAKSLGADVEIAPRKTSVSLRRRKQFALITPATQSRVDLGLALKGDPPAGRLEKGDAMCSHRVRLASASDFDAEAKAWMKEAYGRAG